MNATEMRETEAPSPRPFRVLSLDGGGMRGVYSSSYLASLAAGFARRRHVESLDIGAAFDLIVGTSVGGIIACALAANVPLSSIVSLFRTEGPRFFPRRLPSGVGLRLLVDLIMRPAALRAGTEALKRALEEQFGNTTLANLYELGRPAIAITAVDLGRGRGWVFKTPHLPKSNRRDDGLRLVDVCLATSAAPVYRSLAALDQPGDEGAGHLVFADGGLWANNPVLVGLVEALRMSGPDQPIEIFCLGTCPRPPGEQVPRAAVHRGLAQWQFGGRVASLTVDAQERAFDDMARLLSRHVARRCEVVRFPSHGAPATLLQYLDLDDTRAEAVNALVAQAHADANLANSHCQDSGNPHGRLIDDVFATCPAHLPARRAAPSRDTSPMAGDDASTL
jgi:hypothetical protein